MQALAMFGVPPEKYYPYDEKKVNEDPQARIYAMAQNYQALTYYRLDPIHKDAQSILDSVKANIWCNRPCMFGFVVYDTIDDKTGNVELPTKTSNRRGGHAVTAVAFDDDYEFPKSKIKGGIKFVNSWREEWGQNGFGWLPYEYIRLGLAVDWWTMMTAEWLDTKQFE